MEHPADPDVQCVLADMMRAAAAQWRVSLSARAVARDIGIRHPSIHQLVANETARFDFGTLASLCAYFWCYPGELLVYTIPDNTIPDLVRKAIRRADRPDDLGPLPHIVVNAPVLSLEQQRHLPRQLLTRLEGEIQRIDRDTLAMICRLTGGTVGDILTLNVRWPEL